MGLRRVAAVVGLLQLFMALAMLVACGVALLYGDGDAGGIFLSAVVTAAVGLALYKLHALKGDITSREGFAMVTFAWVASSILGALPFLLTGVETSVPRAVFEAMSGLTTTGATVFADIEALPHGILFWRSLTHWLGGMGIIVLVIAVLPYLGVGGMQLFSAEVPGLTPERLRPRIAQTAKFLWLIYLGLTLAQILLYLLGGMGPFDAVNHAFSTLATGGFSTRSASLAAFESPYLHYVTILFMGLAAMSFSLHFRAATGRFDYWRNQEWKFLTMVALMSTGLVMAANLRAGSYALTPAGAEEAFRQAAFQVTSIVSTTGFVSADYELWVPGAQAVLFALFFVGGMAGSTGGGIKAVRVLLLLKATANEIRKHLHPKAILLTRVGKTPVREEVLANVVGFVILYLLLLLAGTLALAFSGLDLLTALGASMASVGNVGPGFALVGATDHYGWMNSAQLSLLGFLMLVGRLEIYTVLVLFHGDTWKRRHSFR